MGEQPYTAADRDKGEQPYTAADRDKGEQPYTAADGDKGGRQRWLLTGGQREADGDVCSLFWGAKIGDFWEICKRIGEKMRKIVYFVYFIARICGRRERTSEEGLSVYPSPATGQEVKIGAFRAYFQLKGDLKAQA